MLEDSTCNPTGTHYHRFTNIGKKANYPYNLQNYTTVFTELIDIGLINTIKLTHVHRHTRRHARTHTRARARMCKYVCMYVCMYVCVIYTYMTKTIK